MTSALLGAAIGPEIEERLLMELRRAVEQAPAYRLLLAEHGVRIADVTDLASFSRLCPLLNKRNTFLRFPLEQLGAGEYLRHAAEVLTSSGHGGQFSFGVISRAEAAASAGFIDAALDAAFGVATRPTLAINCLPMGVIFSSRCMTVATTSVREDMALALVKAVGVHYEQTLLVGDPLFMKRLTDHARETGMDWRRFRVQALLGEEIFGEHFRTYLGQCLGLAIDRPEGGHIMSSFGVGELGLHLCFETPATVAVRRSALDRPALARDLLGCHPHNSDAGAAQLLPMMFTFNPHRTFIEIVNPGADGYGALTISMLDPDRSIPLLRYQTGDLARLLDGDQLTAKLLRHGAAVPLELPPVLVALKGRVGEALPNGSHVGFYKDALYTNPECAALLSGAFRLTFAGGAGTMHVQLARGAKSSPGLEQELRRAVAAEARPIQLVLWPYAAFPFGMTLDYERKFSHYVPGELDAGTPNP